MATVSVIDLLPVDSLPDVLEQCPYLSYYFLIVIIVLINIQQLHKINNVHTCSYITFILKNFVLLIIHFKKLH